MSNVLIGIIGVVLLIGMALAGAAIMGEEFMTASATTSAATMTSHMNQIAQGVQVLQARRGITLPSSVADGIGATLVSYNALEETPVNPVAPANPYIAVDAIGQTNANPIRFIAVQLGTGSKARDVCFAIEDQAGNTNAAAVVDSAVPFDARVAAAPRLGCISNTYASGAYTAYIPV